MVESEHARKPLVHAIAGIAADQRRFGVDIKRMQQGEQQGGLALAVAVPPGPGEGPWLARE